jgi:hypothetical protein
MTPSDKQPDQHEVHWTTRLPQLTYIIRIRANQVLFTRQTTCMKLKQTVFHMLNQLWRDSLIDDNERQYQRALLDNVIAEFTDRFYEMKKKAQNKRVFER